MNCHGGGSHGGGRRKTWMVLLAVAVLTVVLWVSFGNRGLVGVLPFVGILLCPLIHGAMFLFLGKSLMHRGVEQKNPGSAELE